MVVDDDPLQLRALERTTRHRRDVTVTTVDNPIDALLAVGTLKPDLVILDVYMPGLDGIETCRRIKANPDTRNIRVLIASAAMNPELEHAARDAGAYGTIEKPIKVPSTLDVPRRIAKGTVPPPMIEAAPSEPALARGSAPVVAAEPPTMRGANLLVEMLDSGP